MEKKRPVGLTVLAVINFVFTGVGLLSVLAIMVSRTIQSSVPLSAYSILSPLITSVLLLLSGIGFLKMKRGLGYILGNITGVGSLLNIVVYNALSDFSGFVLHIPSMIYPVILLIFLNLRYKNFFLPVPK